MATDSRAPGIDLDLEHRCPRCRSPLDLHQPDPDRPDRLLATCGGCGAWYLPGHAAGGELLRLPDGDRDEVRTANPHPAIPAHHLRAAGP